MDYKKLVQAAGYKGDKADYIARKLESRKVPVENLNGLGSYFPGMGELAGESLHELGLALYGVAHKPMEEKLAEEKPKVTKTATKDTAVKDGD